MESPRPPHASMADAPSAKATVSIGRSLGKD